tara:strand:+ start:60 stop:272 length:213 start_codon:yes stop_codon:yes gene_type:complete
MSNGDVLGSAFRQYVGEAVSPLMSKLAIELRPTIDDVIETEIMPKAQVYIITGLAVAGGVGALVALLMKR